MYSNERRSRNASLLFSIKQLGDIQMDEIIDVTLSQKEKFTVMILSAIAGWIASENTEKIATKYFKNRKS